jgi:hypothetical protein
MSEDVRYFLNTAYGRKFFKDVTRIADSLEILTKSVQPMGEYLARNMDLLNKVSRIQRHAIEEIEKELSSDNDSGKEDIHEPGC